MNFFDEAARRIPSVAFGASVAVTTAGLVLAVVLVVFGGTSLHIAQLVILVLGLVLVVCLRAAEKLNLGLPITRHELRMVAIVSVVSTWITALLAILASQRYLHSESSWQVHLTIQILLALVMPFAVRSLSGWYARTFWRGKVSNAIKSAGIGPKGGRDLVAAAKNYALPETLAWVTSGAWALGTTISNLHQTASWDDGTVYSTVVVTMTTFSIAYYYSHPDQRRLRNLINGNME